LIPKIDFGQQFEVVGLLARFFRGGLTIPDMMKMKWKEILFWYDIYELQITEEEVVYKYQKEISEGKRQRMPKHEVIRKKVDEKIAERRKNINGEI
jgi:hypothetical protein